MSDFQVEDIERIRVDDLVIAVIGTTGSGKSHKFIDILGKYSTKNSGHKLEACTQAVNAIRIGQHVTYGDRLVFLDTPGFDDSSRSDIEVLDMVRKWLQKTYDAEVKLAGVVYLHRITDNRLAGTHPHQNLHYFGQLCNWGEKSMKKVVLASTMWDKVGSAEAGERRENELKDRYWGTIIKDGAVVERFHNTVDSAWRIIDIILKEGACDTTSLKQELDNLKDSLCQTEEGKSLYTQFQKQLVEQKEAMQALADQTKGQNGSRPLKELEEYKRIRADLEKTLRQMMKMKIPVNRRVMLFFAKKSRAAPRK